MGRRNIPEQLEYYFTFVQADGILKNIWNITPAFVHLLGFVLRADVFQNPQLLKYVYVSGNFEKKSKKFQSTLTYSELAFISSNRQTSDNQSK